MCGCGKKKREREEEKPPKKKSPPPVVDSKSTIPLDMPKKKDQKPAAIGGNADVFSKADLPSNSTIADMPDGSTHSINFPQSTLVPVKGSEIFAWKTRLDETKTVKTTATDGGSKRKKSATKDKPNV